MSINVTAPVDEYAYLGQQADGAKRCMIRTIGDVGTKIEGMVDLDGRMQRSPWLTLGVIVAAGVLAAELLPRRTAYEPPVEPQRSPGANPFLASALTPFADTVAQVLAEVAPAIVAAMISPAAPTKESETPPVDATGSEG